MGRLLLVLRGPRPSAGELPMESRSAGAGEIMTRITKAMIERSGWRYCCVCRKLGPRVKAHWTHEGRDYCDDHKPSPTPITEPRVQTEKAVTV